MFKINDREIKNFESDLKTFARRALPFATKNTLNQAGFHARKLAQRDIQVKMVLRNTFTKRSIQVEPTRTLNINRQATTVGSTAPYMEDQEFGATKNKTGSEGVTIATGYSAGQENQRPRTRLPRKPNKLQNIRLKHRRKQGSRKQRNAQAIQQAASSSNKFTFLDLGRRKGIFKITGSRKRIKIKMVWDMTRQSVKIPANPWLKPVVDTTVVKIPEFYRKSLIFQLKRNNLFNS